MEANQASWSPSAAILYVSGVVAVVSLVAAAVAMLATLPVAILAVRYPSGWTTALERVSYAGNALPGIVVSIRTAEGKLFTWVTTGEGGAYEFPAVPVGQYEVFSEFAGYTTESPVPVKVTPSGLAMPPRLVLREPGDPDAPQLQ